MVWIVSILPLISSSPGLYKPLETVKSGPASISIAVTFIFHSFSALLQDPGICLFFAFFYFLFKPAHWPMGRVFPNGSGDLSSIPGRVIPKTLKMVLDTSLFSIQHYKVRIRSKVEQSSEWSGAVSYTSV